MPGIHFLPAFWLPFLLSAISVYALPQTQSDFNVQLNHDDSTGNLGQGGYSDFIPKWAYPILLNDQLLTPEPPLDVFVVENNNHNCRSSSSSSDNSFQSSLVSKREVLVCPPLKPKSSQDPTPDSTPDRDDVTTGYICKDKNKEEWFAKNPDPEGRLFKGKDLQLGWKRKAKRAAHRVMTNDMLLRI